MNEIEQVIKRCINPDEEIIYKLQRIAQDHTGVTFSLHMGHLAAKDLMQGKTIRVKGFDFEEDQKKKPVCRGVNI